MAEKQVVSAGMTGTNAAERILNGFLSLLPANIVMLAAMTGLRVAFFVFFSDRELLRAHPGYFAESFWMGIRYDASVIAYINMPVTVLLLAFSRDLPRFARFVRRYYTAMFSLVIFISFVDFGFYTYFKDHLNSTILDFFKTDVYAIVAAIIFDKRFLPAIVLLAALAYGIYRLGRKTHDLLTTKAYINLKNAGAGRTAAVCFAIVCLNIVVARGGLGGEVLNTSHSDFSPYDSINRLSLNGVKTSAFVVEQEINRVFSDHDLMRTFGYGDVNAVLTDYRDEHEGGGADIWSALRKRTPRDEDIEHLQPNVVFILMESFGSNLIRFNSPSFNVLAGLEQHFREDFFFKNILPPGWLTTHAIESYFLGVPRRPVVGDMMNTSQAAIAYETSPAYAFKNAGYSTEMIYGASLRLRGVGTSSTIQGFDRCFGKFEMPGDYPRNTWGVQDKEMYEFLFQRLEAGRGNKPKFIVTLTCSNHPPFAPLPKDYAILPLEVPRELDPLLISDRDYVRQRLSYYQYACSSVSGFLTRLKHSEFADNTIVFVIGDHSFFDIFKDRDSCNFPDKYPVPLYVYLPEKLKKKYHPDLTATASSADVLSTLYTVSLSKKEYYSFGESIMEKYPVSPAKRIAVNAAGLITDGDMLAKYDSANKRFTVLSPGNGGNGRRDDAYLVRQYRAFMSLVDYYVRCKYDQYKSRGKHDTKREFAKVRPETAKKGIAS